MRARGPAMFMAGFLAASPAQAGLFRKGCDLLKEVVQAVMPKPWFHQLDLEAVSVEERHLISLGENPENLAFLRSLPPGSKVTKARFGSLATGELVAPVRFRRRQSRTPSSSESPEVYETQIVEPITALDRAMLGHSRLQKGEGERREIGHFAFKTRHGDTVNGDMFPGFAMSIPASTFYGAFGDAMARYDAAVRAGKAGGDLVEIVFSHTHPNLDVIVQPADGKPALRFNHELDRTDWEGARLESENNRGIIYTIRAVSPNGYAYKASFLDGKFLEPSSDIPEGGIVWPH